MKFTLSWLKDHLETEAGASEIAERLTAIGLEVESIGDRGAALAPFTVGRVVSADRHPNADRLRVCVVDIGTEQVQVVCGAPNARAGLLGVFAPVGSVIPGTGVELKRGVIRGVESNGMLCSEREMGLGEDHGGIIELPDDAPVGAPFAQVAGLDDPLFDVAITPNRADCLGVRGIARDLAAAGIGRLKALPQVSVPRKFAGSVGIRFDFPAGEENACPLFLGRLIRGVRNGQSPAWLHKRLTAIGLRPISTLVDITNFFTIDQCRPLHAFDAKKLNFAQSGAITLRFARAGESLAALDGKTYELDPGVTVIADDKAALSLGGIIGGEASGVGAATSEVFLEAALFDTQRTAATGRRLGIESDARYRFERGLDPAAAYDGMERATAMIVELCGGEAGEIVAAGKVPDTRRNLRLRNERVRTLTGVDAPAAEQKRILSALGFALESETEDGAEFAVPSWRADIEGEADLVEEIVRIYGYERIPATSLTRSSALPQPAWTAEQLRIDGIRRMLAMRGLEEAVTWSFMAADRAQYFTADPAKLDALRLANPISADLDIMRPAILPNLAAAAARNADHGMPDVALFEIGPQYRGISADGQSLVAAGVRAGAAGPRHWAAAPRPVDAFDAKADALAVLGFVGIAPESVQITRDAPQWYHPARSGTLRRGPQLVLAHFGELHPAIAARLDSRGPVAAFEVFLDALGGGKAEETKAGKARPAYRPRRLLPVERDFAFVVDEKIAADAVLKAVRTADRALVAGASIFDLYAGEGLPESKKSIAVTVTLQPSDKTLTDAEIDAVTQKIVAAVAKATGGTLRS